MKKHIATLGIIAAFIAGPANAALDRETVAAIGHEVALQMVDSARTLNLIEWKVGDTANYDVSALFGKVGTMVKTVDREEGEAIWVKSSMDLMGQKQVVEMLINRADAKVLKMIQNGKEVEVPNDPLEVISQDYAEITVPAGKFKTIHIVAKSAKVKKIEVWANPQETVMEGSIKQIVSAQIEVKMELTSFKKIQ
ncbi:MAG: hypothetical protein AB7P04_01495 [Bacteriovoracia bacterium]